MILLSVTVVYFDSPLLNGSGKANSSTTATLVIDFGKSNVPLLQGNAVIWSKSAGKWSYSLTADNITEFTFENVTFNGTTAWSLMLTASQIMNETTGHNLTYSSIYYPEFGEILITGIEGVNNTNALFWQYDVNSNPASYGVQLQKISDGDIVSWAMSPQ